MASAPVILALTSTFWRNAWRYKAPRLPPHLLGCGHVARATPSPSRPRPNCRRRLVLGYADAPVNALLGVDGEREATIALCAHRPDEPGRAARPRAVPRWTTRRARSRRVRSTFPTSRRCTARRRSPRARRPPPGGPTVPARAAAPQGELIPLRPLPPEQSRRRRSRRSSSSAARRATTIPTRRSPSTAFSTLLDRSVARLRDRLPGPRRAAAARRLPDRQQRRGTGAWRLPAPPAAPGAIELLKEGELPAAGAALGGGAGLRGATRMSTATT